MITAVKVPTLAADLRLVCLLCACDDVLPLEPCLRDLKYHFGTKRPSGVVVFIIKHPCLLEILWYILFSVRQRCTICRSGWTSGLLKWSSRLVDRKLSGGEILLQARFILISVTSPHGVWSYIYFIIIWYQESRKVTDYGVSARGGTSVRGIASGRASIYYDVMCLFTTTGSLQV